MSAVGHEIDVTLSDLAADLRAPTPSAAAELAVWSKREFEEVLRSHLYTQTSRLNFLVTHARQNFDGLVRRPVYLRPYELIFQRQQYLDNLVRLLTVSGKKRFQEHQNALSLLLTKLEGLSPLKILARGYSVTRRLADGLVITTSADIAAGQRIETRLSAGRLISLVEEKHKT